MTSRQAALDVPLSLNPQLGFWQQAPAVFAEQDPSGSPLPAYRTEVRSRWTTKNLYLLFICPFQELYLKPRPTRTRETFALWNWDVAEAFIGTDFSNIAHYKEFEVSPQGEWVDLDIDLSRPHHEDGWTWNSRAQFAARIDRGEKRWYGAMRIPWAALQGGPPQAGERLRINLFRVEGPTTRRVRVTWRPTAANTFHVPERFGDLRLTGSDAATASPRRPQD